MIKSDALGYRTTIPPSGDATPEQRRASRHALGFRGYSVHVPRATGHLGNVRPARANYSAFVYACKRRFFMHDCAGMADGACGDIAARRTIKLHGLPAPARSLSATPSQANMALSGSSPGSSTTSAMDLSSYVRWAPASSGTSPATGTRNDTW
jgi:hypothetical protein